MFYKKVNKNNNKEMFEFLKNHFEYFTDNSWNISKSIANNVKLYNLDIKGKWIDLLEILQLDNYETINLEIFEWEQLHKDYTIGFNGRSGGYLVLYNKENNRTILSDFIYDSDNYKEFKMLLKDYGYTLKDYQSELIKQVELVQDFDKLCDNLVATCQYMLDNYTVKEEEKTYTIMEKVLVEK